MFKKMRLALKKAQVSRLRKAIGAMEAQGWGVKRSVALPGGLVALAFALMAANGLIVSFVSERMGKSAANAMEVVCVIVPFLSVMVAALTLKRWAEEPFKRVDSDGYAQKEKQASRELEVLELEAVASAGDPSKSRKRL